eukprot:gene2955-1937_t
MQTTHSKLITIKSSHPSKQPNFTTKSPTQQNRKSSKHANYYRQQTTAWKPNIKQINTNSVTIPSILKVIIKSKQQISTTHTETQHPNCLNSTKYFGNQNPAGSQIQNPRQIQPHRALPMIYYQTINNKCTSTYLRIMYTVLHRYQRKSPAKVNHPHHNTHKTTSNMSRIIKYKVLKFDNHRHSCVNETPVHHNILIQTRINHNIHTATNTPVITKTYNTCYIQTHTKLQVIKTNPLAIVVTIPYQNNCNYYNFNNNNRKYNKLLTPSKTQELL